jgi:hypothetical protein
MAASSDTATFNLNLGGNAAESARDTADAMESLRQKIVAGKASISEMRTAYQNLRGTTDEVKAAKAALSAKLNAERDAVSKVTLAMLAQQAAGKTSLTDAQKAALEKTKLIAKLKEEAEKQKKLKEARNALPETQQAARTRALSAALQAGGGPVAGLLGKLQAFKEVAGEHGAGGATAYLTLGIVGAVAAAAALAAGLAGIAYKLGKFALTGADAARSAQLLRQAFFNGNAQWGKQAGEQIDALARNVPTAKAEIQALGAELAKQNIGGQTWVDTLNAVTQASAALGNDAGGKIKEFIERGRQMNRLQINPRELIGTGVTFQEVAKELAASLHVGVDEAQKALFEGRVKLGDGAAALRKAVEKKFGGINLAQMLSFENIAKKLEETFQSYTKDIDLEPLLKGVKEVLHVFDLSTVSGQALKQIINLFGNDFSKAIGASGPASTKFLYGIILGAQDVTIAYLNLRKEFRKTFGPETIQSATALNIALGAGRGSVLGIELSLKAVLSTMQAIKNLNAAGDSIGEFYKSVYRSVDAFGIGILEGFKSVGKNIIKGLTDGIYKGFPDVGEALKGLGEVAKKTFKQTLMIQSPSKAFREYGEYTTEGYAQGVEKGSDRAQGAVGAMVKVPTGSPGGGSSSASSSVTVNVTINAGGGDAKAVAAAVSSDAVTKQLTKAVIDAIKSRGLPVPS